MFNKFAALAILGIVITPALAEAHEIRSPRRKVSRQVKLAEYKVPYLCTYEWRIEYGKPVRDEPVCKYKTIKERPRYRNDRRSVYDKDYRDSSHYETHHHH